MLVINRKTFSECLSRVSVLSSEKYKGVRILTDENSMHVSTNNPEKEEGAKKVYLVNIKEKKLISHLI